MTFSLSLVQRGKQTRAELKIGDESLSAPLITSRWTARMYQQQWSEALKALANESVKRCILITDIQPAKVSFGIMYWALFKEGREVILQERFSRDRVSELLGSPAEIEQFIPPRRSGIDSDDQISEWKTSFEEVRAFARHLSLGEVADHRP